MGPSSPDQSELPPDVMFGSNTSKNLTLAESMRLGSQLEYLQRSARHRYEVGNQENTGILAVLQGVENILRSSKVETVVTGQVAEFRSDIEDKYEASDTLDANDSEELQQKAITWNHLLHEDLGRQQRIPVSDTGLMDSEKLIESPENLVSSAVWDWLDQRPREDIREACKTLVIDCSTSSVMLSLRAVEHCLREWYEKDNEPLESAAWGRVLDRLMEEYVEEEKKNDTILTQLSDLPPVLTNLYYLKEKRNEVSHPDESPTGQEARQTLMIVASTITEIYHEMLEDTSPAIEMLDIGSPDDYDDNQEFILDLLRELDSRMEGGVPRFILYQTAEEAGLRISEATMKETIQDILMDGIAYEPADRTLKPI